MLEDIDIIDNIIERLSELNLEKAQAMEEVELLICEESELVDKLKKETAFYRRHPEMFRRNEHDTTPATGSSRSEQTRTSKKPSIKEGSIVEITNNYKHMKGVKGTVLEVGQQFIKIQTKKNGVVMRSIKNIKHIQG